MSRSLASFVMAAAAVILLAVLVLLVAVPPFVDWQRQRAPLEMLLSRALGEEVSLGGDISLRLLPVPRLEAEEVSLGADVTMEALRLEADWPALLGGGLQAGKAHARGLKTRLLRRSGEDWHLPLRPLAIGGITIDGGSVSVRDEVWGISETFAFAEARIEGGVDFLQSGRVSVRLDAPDSPLGDALELRLSLQAAAGGAKDMSLHAASNRSEMRFQGRLQGRRLHGALEAHHNAAHAGNTRLELRSDVTMDAEAARFRELELQWGAAHWRGEGIAALAEDARLDFSLKTSVFEAGDALALLHTLPDLRAWLAKWDSLGGSLALQAESLLWQGVALGAGAVSARLDAEDLVLDAALEDLRGGGHVRWQARGRRQGDGFAPLAGRASLDMRRPDFLPVPFLSSTGVPVLLEGAFSWLPRGAFAITDGDLTWAGERLGALDVRLRRVQQGAQHGVVLENMRLQEGDDLLLEADGVLLQKQGGVGARGREAEMEGRINMRLHLSAAAVRERFPALPGGALFAPDANLSLRGEWLFAPPAADLLSATGTLGAADLRFTAEALARLLREGEYQGGDEARRSVNALASEGEGEGEGEKSPVQAFWRSSNGFVEMNGALSRRANFFQGALRAEGSDMSRLFSSWLPPAGKDAGEAMNKLQRLPFTLRTALNATTEGGNRRLEWREMEFSWPGSPAGKTAERLLLRGDGRIVGGSGAQPPRFQARLDGERLVLDGWEFLPLLVEAGETASLPLPNVDIAVAIENLRLGDLPVDRATLHLAGADGILDAVSARGELFGGVGRMRANPPASDAAGESNARDELPRWQFDLHGARLEQAARFLWGDALMRGTLDFSLEAGGDIRRPQTLSGLGTAHLADGMICCIDIAGLRAQARTESVEGGHIASFAHPQAGRAIWTQFGTGAFAIGLEGGILALRGQGGFGESSILAAELDLSALMLRLLAEFSVPVGAEARDAALKYEIEGELLRPRISFDASALEQVLEGLRLQRALRELEGVGEP